MNTAPLRPALHSPALGATTLGTDSPGRHTDPLRTELSARHRTGDLLRAVRVFAGAAFGVVVLGTGTATDIGGGTGRDEPLSGR